MGLVWSFPRHGWVSQIVLHTESADGEDRVMPMVSRTPMGRSMRLGRYTSPSKMRLGLCPSSFASRDVASIPFPLFLDFDSLEIGHYATFANNFVLVRRAG